MTRVKKVSRAACLLTLCIASQLLKNISVYVTGTIINCALVLTVKYCGFLYAVVISVITPVTSFFITGSPIIAAMPVIMPCIMAGNICLVIFPYLVSVRKNNGSINIAGCAAGCLVKFIAMWGTIVKGVIAYLGPSSGLPEKALSTASFTFSVTQLITAVLGCAIALLISKRTKIK